MKPCWILAGIAIAALLLRKRSASTSDLSGMTQAEINERLAEIEKLPADERAAAYRALMLQLHSEASNPPLVVVDAGPDYYIPPLAFGFSRRWFGGRPWRGRRR